MIFLRYSRVIGWLILCWHTHTHTTPRYQSHTITSYTSLCSFTKPISTRPNLIILHPVSAGPNSSWSVATWLIWCRGFRTHFADLYNMQNHQAFIDTCRHVLCRSTHDAYGFLHAQKYRIWPMNMTEYIWMHGGFTRLLLLEQPCMLKAWNSKYYLHMMSRGHRTSASSIFCRFLLLLASGPSTNRNTS